MLQRYRLWFVHVWYIRPSDRLEAIKAWQFYGDRAGACNFYRTLAGRNFDGELGESPNVTYNVQGVSLSPLATLVNP